MFSKIYLSLVTVAFVATAFVKKDDTMEEREISKRTTMSTITPEQMKTIALKAHNDLRKSEAIKEKATDMFQLVYNDSLASIAQAHADKCVWEHAKNLQGLGENMFIITDENFKVEEAVQNWYGEKEFYDYDNVDCSKMCGHYTQVVWWSTKQLGCGVKKCNDIYVQETNSKWKTAYILVCNYSPSGNTIGNIYTKGNKPCERCPNNCVDDALCENSFNLGCKDIATNCTNDDDLCNTLWGQHYCQGQLIDTRKKHNPAFSN